LWPTFPLHDFFEDIAKEKIEEVEEMGLKDLERNKTEKERKKKTGWWW
jgi:hypothetical protein